MLTDSDHRIIESCASTYLILKYHNRTTFRNKKVTRTIIDYKHAEPEHWDNLAKEVDSEFIKYGLTDQLTKETPNVDTLNLIWDRMELTIRDAIMNNIHSTTVPKFETDKPNKNKYVPKQLNYDAYRLYRMIKKGR